jgi:hypothetical protein
MLICRRAIIRHSLLATMLPGAGIRRTIYAIYQFSQLVLGTDPMYLWTDKRPEKRSSIELCPEVWLDFWRWIESAANPSPDRIPC